MGGIIRQRFVRKRDKSRVQTDRRFMGTPNNMDTYRNFIAGKWTESSSSKTVINVNPANTDDIIGTVRQATRDEARAAVEAAAEAFHNWRATPAPARGKIVAKAARLMEEAKEELAQLLTREEGKTVGESRGEVQRSINVAEFCAGESRRMNGETIFSELPSNFVYTIKQPLGVVDASKVRHRSWRRVAPVDPGGYSRGAEGGGGMGCISSSNMRSRIMTLPHE